MLPNYFSCSTLCRVHVFPAEVPSPEAPRSDVVEVRVARKVAPLFGVPVDENPFDRTWICDFTTLSLAELGRGAPSPDRAEQARLDGTSRLVPWDWAGRAVWTRNRVPTPGALTNTTLNRFGPDTKAAAMLTGANRLLRAPTSAVAAACRQLTATGCDPELRLAVWAGLILEVYRAQPALVVAAVQARLVQRSLSARWGTQVDPAGASALSAPSEIHPADRLSDGTQPPNPCQPTGFDLIDTTLPLLGLAEDGPNEPGLLTPEVLDDLAAAWCNRLLAVGRPGRGVVWLVEDAAGSRRAHAMLRVGAAVAPFVASALGGLVSQDKAGKPQQPQPPRLPTLPAAEELAQLPIGHRRAHLLIVHIASSYLRYRDELLRDWPQLREATSALLDQAIERCSGTLGAHDPVTVQLTAYVAYLKVWDCLRTSCPAGDEHLDRLRDSEQAVIAAWQAGRLDPGAASYLLEIAAVAMAEAEQQAAEADRRTSRDIAATKARWAAILASRGFTSPDDPASVIASATDAQIFHLQHYTGWLASTGRRTDLRNALALQQRVAAVRARVVRSEPASFAAKSAAARGGCERTAAIATRLVAATPARERKARSEAAAIAVEHAISALEDPSLDGLLPTGTGTGGRSPAGAPATPSPAASSEVPRIARVVAEALLVGAEHGVAIDPTVVDKAIRLLTVAYPPTSETPGTWLPACRAGLARLAGTDPT